MDIDNKTFDYVVVGAGAAGSAVAARLSEDPQASVLLVEAGGADRSFWLRIPVGYGRTIADPRVNWCYETDPVESLGGRRIFWPRGKVLGGSTAINGLIYIRGQAADYDGWRELGNPGWGYADVLPYFRRAEDHEDGASPYHGAGGPLHVSHLVERSPLCDAFIGSAAAVGLPRNDDFNGAAQAGAGYYQATVRRGERVSAARAYLHPAAARRNLHVATGTLAQRVVMREGRAAAVELSREGVPARVRVRREVILSGGTVNTPQLLMLSGIGPAEHLRSVGVAPLVDLPGVGQNLQDHYGGQITWKCRYPITMNDIMASRWRTLKTGLRWLLRRDGPFSVPAGQAGVFACVGDGQVRPDVQFLFQTFSGGYYENGLYRFSGFANFICPVRPRSRGSIGLRSANPADAPLIRPNYFADPHDRDLLVRGLRLARRLAAAEPLAGFIASEHLPGIDVESDRDVEAYFRDHGGCVSHQVGTCRMGGDPASVVDPELRVRGVAGLRVADASIMPTLVSGNTNAATIMIGEKAADLIRAAAR